MTSRLLLSSYRKPINCRFKLSNRFSKWRYIDCILRHHLLKLVSVVDHVISSDVEMRQFVKGTMIVQQELDEWRVWVGEDELESHHLQVSSQRISVK